MKRLTALSVEEREKVRLSQRALAKEMAERSKREAEERKKAFEARIEVQVDSSFSKEDFNSGLQKIRHAAAHYDKTHPSAVGLDGFSAASLSAGQFREQVRRVFNVTLTNNELSALVKFFAVGGENENDVDCSTFLQHFTKLQREERNRISKEQQELKRLQEQKDREERAQKIQRQEQREREKLVFDDADQESLWQKMLKIGNLFITDSAAYVQELQAIKAVTMTPGVFRDAFHRIFLVHLSFSEIGALINALDE
eukprot:gene34063-43696_t